MWYFLSVGILILFMLDIYSIIKGKPTRKAALKRWVNMLAYLLLGFGIIFIIQMIWILAIIGNQELAKSTDVNCRIIADGLLWVFNIITASFIFIVVLDVLNALIRKKKLQVVSVYYNWTDKLDKEGFLKYTDEEKEYNKAQDIKSSQQLRRWFPFIKKFDKKVV